MPIVEIMASTMGPAMTAEGEGRLVDLCDDHGAPIGFWCRSADCGTCRVEVLVGAELIEPAQEDERALLQRVAAPPEHRLACQATLRAGAGLVRLRWVTPPRG